MKQNILLGPFSLLTNQNVMTNLSKPVAQKNCERSLHAERTIKGGIMIEVTPSATTQIAEYFKGKEVSPIRIFLNEGG